MYILTQNLGGQRTAMKQDELVDIVYFAVTAVKYQRATTVAIYL